MIRHVSAVTLILIIVPGLKAQEVITPLYGNPVIRSSHVNRGLMWKSAFADTLELPFFDDFSNSTIHPDAEMWDDADAFINNSYCIDPVSNGVATLDAVGPDGSIYPHATIDPNTFVADHLTSRPINLFYPAGDSLYFSFLYQPEGLGEEPEEQDSLLVDFYSPSDSLWINVWGIPGRSLHPFRHAMIPVTDPRFLADGFRFRFRNRASLSRNDDYPDKRANVDHWNVDYVRLGRNRSAADTVLRDVAFSSALPSVLKDLTSLPWSHFEDAYNTALDPMVQVRYRNNDTIARNVTRSLVIEEPLYGESYTPAVPTAQDIPAGEDTLVEFDYFYPLEFGRGDSAILRFRASLRTDEFDPKINDTVVYDLVFHNYYAYDDGTPEAGYGLRGQGTRDGKVAVRYNSYRPDRIGGVDICFNHLYDSLNLDYYFKLMVWGDNDGVPGKVLLEDTDDHTPEYSLRFPGFTRYYFTEPVEVDGIFYVGWKQYNEYLLNVGFDRNNNPDPHVLFYNFQGIWETSNYPGVILFRPFLYDETTGAGPAVISSPLHIYPNPASGMIHFMLPDSSCASEVRMALVDAAGRVVKEGIIRQRSMDVSTLPEGIYFLKLDVNGSLYHAKLLINR